MAAGIMAAAAVYPASAGLNAPAYDTRTPATFPYGWGSHFGEYWGGGAPGYAATTSSNGAGSLTTPSIPSYAKAGAHALTFGDDWFNRIHITPMTIAFGNVSSPINATVRVWNSYLGASQTLTSISAAGGDGITLTGAAAPVVMAANSELAWNLNVGIIGPAQIAASYTFTFSGLGAMPPLTISGSRIIAWTATPNWQQPVVETIEYKTDVMIAWTGAEQRRALRIAPRRSFSFDLLIKGQERRYIEATLFDWSSRVWALPIWPDGQRLTAAISAGASSITCDTVNRDFAAGGLAMLYRDAVTFEVVTIASITAGALALTYPTVNAWAVGARIYPLRMARLASYPAISRDDGQHATLQPSFLIVEPCDWPAATGLATYRGLPVLEDSPDSGAGADSTYDRQTVTIDNETGVIAVDDTAGVGFPTITHNWWLSGRTARAAFRSLLYLLKGRQGEIWVPSYQSDLKLAADVSGGATTLSVEFTGYALYLQGQTNRRDIRIELTNGTVYYRRILSASAASATVETLVLDAALTSAIPATSVRRISYMALSRLATDAIDINHLSAADGLAVASTGFRALNRGSV
jgi:hypothetical protein